MRSLSEFNPAIHEMYLERIKRLESSNMYGKEEQELWGSTGNTQMWTDTEIQVEHPAFGEVVEHMIMDPINIPEDIQARIRGDHDDRSWYQRDIDEFKNLGKRIATVVNSVFRMEGKSEVDDDLAKS